MMTVISSCPEFNRRSWALWSSSLGLNGGPSDFYGFPGKKITLHCEGSKGHGESVSTRMSTTTWQSNPSIGIMARVKLGEIPWTFAASTFADGLPRLLFFLAVQHGTNGVAWRRMKQPPFLGGQNSKIPVTHPIHKRPTNYPNNQNNILNQPINNQQAIY